MTLLERDALLSQLRAQWCEACAGPGRLVFVEGEAGIGKTSLLHGFSRSRYGETRVLWGACEALLTPRPLGALDDIAQQAGGVLAQRLSEGADRHHLFVALLDTLAERSTLVVLEDLHWADDATLDLVRYVGRRIARTRSLLLASYRSDEVVPAHPLRAVLGDLATTGVLRLAPPPLSLAAVRTLCAGHAIDAAALHRETGGNPFFVTEVLATGVRGVPATVQDAVLARAGRLSPSARAVLDAAAIAGPRTEAWLLRDMTAAESTAIDECLATGVLCADSAHYTFRHELARQAVLQAMTSTRAMSLHRFALQSLTANEFSRDAAARLALHAVGAGDGEAVRRWAPRAAREAAARGAHRQAVEHWARALTHTTDSADRAALLDEYAVEAHMSAGVEQAIPLRREAARTWQQQGRPDRAAVSLAELSMLFVLGGRRADADAALEEARRLPLEPGSAAALEVQNSAAWLCAHDGDIDAAVALATPVLETAERCLDVPAMLGSLTTIGAALLSSGRVDDGVRHLERALALAVEARDDRRVGQTYANLGAACVKMLRLPQAADYLRKGIEFCAERDLDAPRLHQVASWSALCIFLGRWDAAEAAAREVIDSGKATVIARVAALTALGRLRARRGDPGVWEALNEARSLAAGTGDSVVSLVARARAEAAWLEGRSDLAAQEAASVMPQALARPHLVALAELLLWRRLGGAEDVIADAGEQHPVALEAAGRWQEAAQAWRALSCPFETARALSQGDPAARREALAICESLGARPLAERLRQHLRAAGVRGLPRGPRASTQKHPAGLTSKEVAVLCLLASGLRNKEIAQRLHRSPRTVDHHLQAIFDKLGVTTRAEAVSAAYRFGLVTPDRTVQFS
jgi:DNA-binding CsgD family transcriptional regulator/tetratricopeptide (TPR) repeat protein